MDDKSAVKPDPRVRLAAERTMLAWVRTGLAMMGFGFVVARFGFFLRELTKTSGTPEKTGLSPWLGIALVLLGVAMSLAAAYEHLQFLRRLERGETTLFPRWSLGLVAAVVMALVGIGMAIYLLTKTSI
jgi:putative membrane protein